MKNHTFAPLMGVLVILAVVGAPVLAKPATNPYFVPGLWQLHIVTYGTGTSVMKRLTKTICLKHQPRAMKPHGQMASMCHVTNHRMVGDTLTWSTACHSPSFSMMSQGRAVYHKTTLEEWVSGHVLSPEKMNYRVHVMGKRIASCATTPSGH